MQVIFAFPGSPEQYVAESAHRHVLRPAVCPACGRRKRFESLGYYTRGLSRTGSPGVMPISIRRFRCVECRVSVSLLPDFAQPYRLVRNETIQMFFDGSRDADDIQRWDYLLRRYLHRFREWLPKLILESEAHQGRPFSESTAAGAWGLFQDLWGPLALATGRLVRTRRVTAFGIYRCHAVPGG